MSAQSNETGGFQIKELTAIDSPDELLLYANLSDSFTAKAEESLQSGIDLYFSFYVELYKTAPDWPDELIASINFQRKVRYDTLKDDYVLSLGDRAQMTKRFSSLQEVQKSLEEINDVAVTPLAQLIPAQSYILRMRVLRNNKPLALGKSTILPFMNNMKAKSPWKDFEFVYE